MNTQFIACKQTRLNLAWVGEGHTTNFHQLGIDGGVVGVTSEATAVSTVGAPSVAKIPEVAEIELPAALAALAL